MICSLDETKILLNISGTSKDNQIQVLAPLIEEEIHEYTKNHFIKDEETVYIENSTLSFDSATNKILDSDDGFEDFRIKQNIKIFGSKHNDGIANISYIADDYSYIIVSSDLEIVDESEDSDSYIRIYKVTYPKNIKIIFSNMMKYRLSSQKKSEGVSSETFSKYSVSYDTVLGQYPDIIIKSLNKYAKFYKKEY